MRGEWLGKVKTGRWRKGGLPSYATVPDQNAEREQIQQPNSCGITAWQNSMGIHSDGYKLRVAT